MGRHAPSLGIITLIGGIKLDGDTLALALALTPMTQGVQDAAVACNSYYISLCGFEDVGTSSTGAHFGEK